MLPVALATAPAANAAGVGAGLSITADDVAFILKQIQISETHATKAGAGAGQLVPPTSVLDCTGGQPCVTDPTLPEGLRQVNGRGNNLLARNVPTTPMQAADPADLGAADRAFYRLGPANWRLTETGGSIPLPPPLTYVAPGSLYSDRSASVQDSAPRMISNLVADQSPSNPAAVAAAGGNGQDTVAPPPGLNNPGPTMLIPNIPAAGLPAPGQPAAAPTSGMFTLFGQFFDHGLDLVGKTNSEVVIVPLPVDDPLITLAPGTPNFIAVSRTVVDANLDGENTTTPWIDQNQTYTSHPSHQVFLREYTPGSPVATGRLIDSAAGGYIANWGEVKAQAASSLGITLTDADVTNVPLLLTDEYGNFIPAPNGYPQIALAGGGVASGAPGAPIAVPANALRTGHAFLDDIANGAAPRFTAGVLNPALYNAALLSEHFITGDGRGNENIGLTAVHTMFHSEHNRLAAELNTIITGNPTLNSGFNAPGWTYNQRLFQAARFVNEMEYQHAVFEEFARTLSPAIRPFAAYDPTLQGDIPAEFAHAVYRFGHSMLRETVDRTRPDGTDDSMTLLEGFLNPTSFKTGYADASAAAGSIARGMNNQRSSEIDEFITSTLRNSLLGLPLDLPTLNLARGRDTGTPSLQQTRVALGLGAYASWAEFAAALTHPQTFQNFVAAYAPNATLATAFPGPGAFNPNSEANRTAAGAVLAADLNFTSGSAGLADVDLWMGGLAERRPAVGGQLLGPTFNAVFQKTMEDLQEGDRFYYLDRLAGLNLLTSIEGNTLSEMFVRNTDAEVLPANLFAVPSLTVDLRTQGTGLLPLPAGVVEGPQVAPYNRNATYTGLLNVTIGGTANRDNIRTSVGDDTIRGGDGDDLVNGDDGADVTVGGNGDDIIVNTGGADTMLGGPGADAFNGGPNGDVMNGGTGSDYMFSGALGAITLGGSGDERQLGAAGTDGFAGDDGNDWLEGGAGADGLTGDTIAPFGVDLNTPGEDILIGGAGADAFDGGGRMDVFVGASNTVGTTVIPQIDDYLGGLGFDWTTYVGSRTPNADTANFAGALPANDPGLLLDSFIDVEALSGGDFDDTLKGDNRTTLAGLTPAISDGLPAADVPSIVGLNTLLGAAAATGWNNGNILIGGAGSDILQGRAGDDLIDGDAFLQVQLSVPTGPSTVPFVPGNFTPGRTLVSTLAGAVNTRILSGDINPADIFAVKTISNVAQLGTDTAVFAGSSTLYTVTGAAPLFTVAGPDGVDVVRNVEVLQFADATGAPATFVGNVAISPTLVSVSPSSGSTAGGTVVTLGGSGFTGVTGVSFGGTVVAPTTVTDTSITVTSPVHAAGLVDVTVQSANVGGSPTLPNAFTYVTPPPPGTPVITSIAPSSGTTAGGTSVVITGTDLGGATAVTFDGVSAPFVGNSATQVTATSPAHAAGAVTVTVTAPGGVGSSVNGFTYVTPAPPAPPASGGGSSGSSSSSGGSSAAATPPAAPAATTPAAPVTNPVTPPAASVPAVTAVTLTVTQAPSSKVATAPKVSAKAGQKVTLKLTGLQKSAQYGAKVKINGKWVSLGSFKSTKAGKATLKSFLASTPGTYTVMLTDSKGKKSYVKVIAS